MLQFRVKTSRKCKSKYQIQTIHHWTTEEHWRIQRWAGGKKCAPPPPWRLGGLTGRRPAAAHFRWGLKRLFGSNKKIRIFALCRGPRSEIRPQIKSHNRPLWRHCVPWRSLDTKSIVDVLLLADEAPESRTNGSLWRPRGPLVLDWASDQEPMGTQNQRGP